MNPAELAAQIAMTRAFIAADVSVLSINRPGQKVKTASGGFVMTTPVTLPPQEFRIIPQSDRVPVSSTAEGTHKVTEYVLLGMPDADIKRYDQFELFGEMWEIFMVHDRPPYEKKADVILRGS